MDNISNLLQEAKPLYFARKKRNNQIKTFLAVVVCAGMVSLFSIKQQSFDYDYDTWLFDETYISDTTSMIEEMGLPVDNYGLLKVT